MVSTEFGLQQQQMIISAFFRRSLWTMKIKIGTKTAWIYLKNAIGITEGPRTMRVNGTWKKPSLCENRTMRDILFQDSNSMEKPCWSVERGIYKWYANFLVQYYYLKPTDKTMLERGLYFMQKLYNARTLCSTKLKTFFDIR